MLTVLDLFRIGIGPSSSHTVGPMRIARRFLLAVEACGDLEKIERVKVELQGSLALTGAGHGTPGAVMLGLMGFEPDTIDPDEAIKEEARSRASGMLSLLGKQTIPFVPAADIDLATTVIPELHPNGLRLMALDGAGELISDETWFSIGGGFIATREELENSAAKWEAEASPLPFNSAAQLLVICNAHGVSIEDVMWANEDAMRQRTDTAGYLDRIFGAMMACIERGLVREGMLPGGLKVPRRAPGLWRKLQAVPTVNERERLFDWLNTYAMAVNEENAAGGRVVTAPTNGAAGIIPAVLRHYCTGLSNSREMTHRFLLTAGGIGILYKQRASISGAEMGCQGEVGVACSMAAAGLAAVWGATPLQVTIAAEIAMEHNLGLTCDPVGGLVQIPCIERNAIGAVKAVNAARLAMHSEGPMRVSLDDVIETMRQTGVDMSSKYKETSQAGLAVNVVAC